MGGPVHNLNTTIYLLRRPQLNHLKRISGIQNTPLHEATKSILNIQKYDSQEFYQNYDEVITSSILPEHVPLPPIILVFPMHIPCL